MDSHSSPPSLCELALACQAGRDDAVTLLVDRLRRLLTCVHQLRIAMKREPHALDSAISHIVMSLVAFKWAPTGSFAGWSRQVAFRWACTFNRKRAREDKVLSLDALLASRVEEEN